MNHHRHMTLPTILMVIAVVLTACAQGPSADSPDTAEPDAEAAEQTFKIDFGIFPAALQSFYPQLANEMGFFRDHGLELEFVSISTGPDLAQALVSGSTNISTQGLGIIWPLMADGEPIVVLTGNLMLEYGLAARPDVPLDHVGAPFPDNILDLKGKSVGVSSRGSLTEAFVTGLAKAAGLDPDTDVDIIPGGVQGLPGGIWYYRVAAVMAAGGLDPGAGTLPGAFGGFGCCGQTYTRSDYWSLANLELPFESQFQPLEPFRNRVVLITGLDMPEAMATTEEPGGDHARGAVLLSGARPRRNAVSPFLGTTIDQMIAAKYGQDTILSSLQVGVEDTGNFGNCNWGYSCAYTNSISWASPTQPLPTQVNPRVVFERLFGDGTSPEERLAGRRQNASILDSVTREIGAFKTKTGLPHLREPRS